MNKRDIKVGMRVRIKSWEDMLKGVGVKIEDNGIKFPQTDIIFNFEMKKLCGKTAIVEKIDERIKLDFGDNVMGHPYLWSYIPQMLEPVEEENVNEEVRYFELVSETTIGKKGDIGKLIHEERVRDTGRPYLLYNEKWDGHSGNGYYEVDKEYEDHCWWFEEDEVKEIKKSKPIETKESKIESAIINGETIEEEKPLENKSFIKKLEFGNIVELRRGDLCLIEPKNNISNIGEYFSLKEIRLRNIKDAVWVSTLDDYEYDFKNRDFETHDIMKVYEDYTLKNLLWERQEIKLSEREIEILKALKVLEFKYIARDSYKDSLFAYKTNPEKSFSSWLGNDSNICRVKKDLFDFVKWEDEKPYSIEELLDYES